MGSSMITASVGLPHRGGGVILSLRKRPSMAALFN